MLNNDWSVVASSTTLNQNIKKTVLSNISIPVTIAHLNDLFKFSCSYPNETQYHFINSFQATGKHLLKFEGLASLVDVILNNKLLFTSTSMFVSYEVEVDLIGDNSLILHFKPFAELFKQKLSRARWRQQLVDEPSLRGVRHTLLGHMPGWNPSLDVVGPYRGISCVSLEGAATPHNSHIYFRNINDWVTILDIDVDLAGSVNSAIDYEINVPSIRQHLDPEAISLDTLEIERHWGVSLLFEDLENKDKWFPFTHGKSVLHDVMLKNKADNSDHMIGRSGVRKLALDDNNGKFQLIINDVPIFCRGACWTTPSITKMPSTRADYEPWLKMMRDAGMNMVRVGGTMLYEGKEFYDLCDELGIMVWQDFMFSNFDYPTTESFINQVTQEITEFLKRTQHNVCITVLCGGSEVYQQAAMLGLPKERYNHLLFSDVIKNLCKQHRPDVVYVENSPSGGELPFQTNKGICHYYGVSAYLRDFSDVRRSDVKFASECLAFSNIPCKETLDKFKLPAVHHPDWKRSVPRDNNVSWDFEDVRDHYLSVFYKIDPNRLRREDPARYLELSRAVSYHLITAVISEWRSNHSNCGGGLVWQLQDVVRGAGWGLIDVDAKPKAAYWAMNQRCQSKQIIVTNEGLNGLDITVINETSENVDYEVKVYCVNGDRIVKESASWFVECNGRFSITHNSNKLMNGFFDITYAYKFGPPVHTATVAQLLENGKVISQASDYPLGFVFAQEDVGLSATMCCEENWTITVNAKRFAHLVHFEIPGFKANVEWIDILPGQTVKFFLIQNDLLYVEPSGYVLALNNKRPVVIEKQK